MPRIYARISEELKAKAKKRAYKIGQVNPSGKANISGYVRYLIQKDIKNLKEENKMTKEKFWNSLNEKQKEMAHKVCENYAGSDGTKGRIFEMYQEEENDITPSEFVKVCYEMKMYD